MSIIERITQIMDSKNLNQSDLCKILGIKDSTFSTWKTRGTDPPAKYILLICEYLEVSTDYLLGRTNEKKLGTNYGIQNHSDNNQGDITNQLNLQGENGLHGKMLGEFDKLDFKDQVKVLNLIAELSEKGA